MTEQTDEFVPYLVLVRLAKGDDGDLRKRAAEALPQLRDALAEIGAVHEAMLSYDGSLAVYLLAAQPNISTTKVVEQLRSPRSHKTSPLELRDQVLVISVETGYTHRLERVEDWLREHNLLTW